MVSFPVILIILLLVLPAHAEDIQAIPRGIIINEVMSANVSILADEDEDYPDWIELYNQENEGVNLNGYGLSDKDSEPFRWIFPDVTIAPDGYLLIFASGKPASYVSGVIRQTGLKDVIIVGDNGGVIWFNHAFPPKEPFIMEMESAAADELRVVRDAITKKFGDNVWVQPNQLTYSLFSRGIDVAEVYKFCDHVFKEKQIKNLVNPPTPRWPFNPQFDESGGLLLVAFRQEWLNMFQELRRCKWLDDERGRPGLFS